MRYRALTATGDYSFGLGPSEFLVNTPATVAQAVLTALLLHQGEWFLNITAGMPWETQVLGYGTQTLYDAAIKSAILGVEGVKQILNYNSSLNTKTRNLTVNVTIDTIYGEATITGASVGILGYGQMPYGGPGPYGGGYTP